jgi:cobalt/nickel transport system permease protein
LWGAWNILVKGALGVAATSVLAATTSTPELLRALARLRVPKPIVAITSFMIRYGYVVRADMRSMKIARESRGYDPRWLWQAKAVAVSAGALFIRSYERGERVYIAMLSRGYAGAMVHLPTTPTRRTDWFTAATAPLSAAAVCVAAIVTT